MTRRILLADDDLRICTVASLILKEAGFDVLTFQNGKALLAAFRLSKPDLVLCDLFMPEMDGLEVISALRGEDPTVKIIAMSGGGFHGLLGMLETARMLGAAAILDKPFTREVLLGTIKSVLDGSATA